VLARDERRLSGPAQVLARDERRLSGPAQVLAREPERRSAMIASVRGRVAAVSPDGAVVEVGGVGLAVHCTPGTLAGLRLGTEARLATSLVVREDSLTLYGFADDDEKHLFELLQTASGVGPRLAQAVLAVLTPDAVRKAIANADTATLTRVPGIGKKGAERLVLELRDRVGPAPLASDGAGRAAGAWPEQVRQALIGLGWTAGQADQAVAAVAETLDDAVPPVPVLLKQAIRLLGRTR
jgi:Holliday junction DNA helicase RuvA